MAASAVGVVSRITAVSVQMATRGCVVKQVSTLVGVIYPLLVRIFIFHTSYSVLSVLDSRHSLHLAFIVEGE